MLRQRHSAAGLCELQRARSQNKYFAAEEKYARGISAYAHYACQLVKI
jgi:hypothetical protein